MFRGNVTEIAQLRPNGSLIAWRRHKCPNLTSLTLLFCSIIGARQQFWQDALSAGINDSHGYQQEFITGSLGAGPLP